MDAAPRPLASSTPHAGSGGGGGGGGEVDPAPLRRKFPKHLVEIYDIDTMLGQGAFSTVWRCVHRATGQVRAVKKIDTTELAPRAIAHEIALMKLLRHTNCLRCYDVFLEAQFVNIVVDLFTGGDLVDGLNVHRQAHGRITDGQLAHVSRQMIAALVHVHGLGIVHRDIKGENFLLDRPDIGDPNCVVALADFGTAIRLDPGATLSEQVGTPQFWAPEVYAGRYDFLADIWATGVTIFVLLSGRMPFDGKEDICKPVGEGERPFVAPSFATPSCIDFIASCLAKDPCKRRSAAEAQRHPWMSTPVGTRPSQATRAIGGTISGIGAVLSCFCECLQGISADLIAANVEANKKRKQEQNSKSLARGTEKVTTL